MNITKKNKLYRYLGIFIKGVMLVLTFWFIYDRISSTENLNDVLRQFDKHFQKEEGLWQLWLALALVPLNWGVETFKWRYLILRIENISFTRAIKAVLSGVTVSVFTPNRIGEYAGRVVYINKADRITAALITVISGLGQLTVTLLLGALSVLFYLKAYHEDFIGSLSIYIGVQLYIVFFVLLLLAFINTSVLTILLSRVKFLKNRFQKYIEVFAYYSQYNLLMVLLLSGLRYIVFSVQYYLLLGFFGVSVSLSEALILIPVYFITLTAIPTITLAELGVREVVAITVFSVASANTIGLVSTSFAIWIINLAFPALLGIVFVLQAKLFKTQ